MVSMFESPIHFRRELEYKLFSYKDGAALRPMGSADPNQKYKILHYLALCSVNLQRLTLV
jgi:hypothetical protein